MKKIDFIEKIVVDILKKGGIGVLPTDTLYGIVGKAQNKETVERIYKVRKREKGKPMIILISSLLDLEKFDIKLSLKQKTFLKKIWPERVSVVLNCAGEKNIHLHRGKETLAFRFPREKWLLELLKKTGPLVVPSANLSGKNPAENIIQAKEYFAENVDFYIDAGTLKTKSSTIIKLSKEGEFEILRQGLIKIKL